MYQKQCPTCGKIEEKIYEPESSGFNIYAFDGCGIQDGLVNRPRAYLAGPIAGNPDFMQWFAARAAAWRDAGWYVINPAEMQPGPEHRAYSFSYYMKRDLPHLLNSDAILLHSNIRSSRGANLELLLACSVGLPVYAADSTPTLNPHPLRILGHWEVFPCTENVNSQQINSIDWCNVPLARKD